MNGRVDCRLTVGWSLSGDFGPSLRPTEFCNRMLAGLKVPVDDATLVGVVNGDAPVARQPDRGNHGRAAASPPGIGRDCPPATYSRAKYGWPFCSPTSYTCTMCGCCSWATASASRRNVPVPARRRGPGRNHLERDQAVRPKLPGLIDDAHAPAAQFARALRSPR